MALTVVSMFTTTPFLRPREGWLPMPMISTPPSGLISATMAAILEVPTSSPTISRLVSLAFICLPLCQTFAPFWGILLVPQLGNAHRESIGITQIHVIDFSSEWRERPPICGNEAVQPCLDLFASEFEGGPFFQPHLPRAARRYLHLLRHF